MTDAEVEFVNLLEDELEKFNSFFVEKEEEYIIRLKELQDRVSKAKDRNDEILKIRREIVDFHGEMVLLENYSALNYTGLVKILKKYDKRTGALLRLPFIQRVLQQPFFTTDLLYKLVKECENLIDRLFPIIDTSCVTVEADGNETSTSSNNKNDGLLRAPKELTEIEYIESLYMKSTISALRALKEIRSKSSTVSAFSLPPLQISGPEDTWNKIPILEQAAK
uniref:Putative SPX domain-containing protein 2-like n=1 Tax=Solanum chacoense TaxID=4108 RepID=A0A0V0HM19_SOLCH